MYERILLITEPVFQRYEIPLGSHGRQRRAHMLLHDSIRKSLIFFLLCLLEISFTRIDIFIFFSFLSLKIQSYPMILSNFRLYLNPLNQESLLNVGNY
jgi:hypothetical protein